eukprot:39966-Pyramimonas_sp.AAC.1
MAIFARNSARGRSWSGRRAPTASGAGYRAGGRCICGPIAPPTSAVGRPPGRSRWHRCRFHAYMYVSVCRVHPRMVVPWAG